MEEAALIHFFPALHDLLSWNSLLLLLFLYMFNYSAAILLLIKVYCALSWLYYLYLFIVYSRVHKKESRWEMGSSKDRLKPRPLLWPLDKWVAFFLFFFFCVVSCTPFLLCIFFFFKWVAFLTQHPTFPFWTKQENNVDIDIGCVVLESTVLNITVKPLMDQEKTAQLCY